MADTKNEQSPLVKAVLALDDYFAELERLGGKINTMELKTDFDFEHAQRLMNRFAECGQGVSDEVMNLSQHLNELRAKAEAIAQGVSERAQLLNSRKTEEQKKFDEFRILGERVRELSQAIARFRRAEGETLTDSDRVELSRSLADFDVQLNPLIERAQALRTEARLSRMRALEQNADALTQTLQAIRKKIGALNLTPAVSH